MSVKRLYFIDAVRAFAILMMLQGHFVDTLLDVNYRDSSSVIFRTWEYFRGITAPTFFTISGLIFSYLLIKAKHTGNTKKRLKKGIMRSFMLIGIGYALRAPVFQWIMGEFDSYVLVIDVLQCIGISLIIIVLIYEISNKKTLIFSILTFLIGLVIFITEPLYRFLELPKWPLFLSNYVSKANGSIFTIIPWFGYVAFGAFIATIFYRYLGRAKFKPAIVTGFFIVGLLLINVSSFVLLELKEITDVEVFKDVANYNYLFIRLGNVLVIFAIFFGFERFLKRPILLKIGQKTLSIYVIHFIIIYGSFTGFGLNRLIGRTLTPWQVVFSAILFLTTVCFISFYYAKTNAYVYNAIRKIFKKLKGLVFTNKCQTN